MEQTELFTPEKAISEPMNPARAIILARWWWLAFFA